MKESPKVVLLLTHSGDFFTIDRKDLVDLCREHLTCAMSINAYSSQKLENLEPDHKEK